VSLRCTPNLILQIRTRIPSELPSREAMARCLVEALRVVFDQLPNSLPERDLELGMTLTDDQGIKTINKAYRLVDAPTDVLSFPLFTNGESFEEEQPEGPPLSLGDIVINLQTIERQASDRGLKLHERFAECMVHGLLHIMGWEHSSDLSQGRMEALEDELVPAVSELLSPECAGET